MQRTAGGPVRACWRGGRSLVTYPANPAQNAQDLTQNNSWLRCSLHAINRVIFHHLRKQVYVLWTALQGPAHLTKRRRSYGKIELPSTVTIFHIVGAFSSFRTPTSHGSKPPRVATRPAPTNPAEAGHTTASHTSVIALRSWLRLRRVGMYPLPVAAIASRSRRSGAAGAPRCCGSGSGCCDPAARNRIPGR